MTEVAAPSPGKDQVGTNERLLFWACFIALIATAFGFVVRTQIMGDWARFHRPQRDAEGEIFGVGLWPFAISIVLFSLIIDRIGYGKAMAFAFLCHVVSAVVTIFTKEISAATGISPYTVLYAGTFVVALGNGTVEAVVNPVVATLFARDKTKWLNILHAGWPGGLVLGGILAIAMGSASWQAKVGLIFLPVIGYGLMMLGRRFPINERVAAGASYIEMLQQVGLFGALIVTYMIISQLGVTFGLAGLLGEPTAQYVLWGIIAALSIGFGVYTRSLGHPLFVFMLLIMVPLATTELGTDSWITDLMTPAMKELGINAGWVLIYTSLIMMILRFFAGAIVHKLSPLGLLAASAAIAAVGLVALSKSQGLLILAAATLYGFGKTFFWPTMLGVVAEQFPKGGALTLNATGGVGMLAVGVIGTALLGNIQDKEVDRRLEQQNPDLHAKVVADEKVSLFGAYKPLKEGEVEQLPEAQKAEIDDIKAGAKKDALMTVAIFPCIMLVCYLILLGYFKTQGGYKPKILISEKEEQLLMTGGAVAADEF
ncbi:MAG: MFS transporter [Isosphaeraceae bacterium]